MLLHTLLAVLALAAIPIHPHNPKAIKLHGAKGMVTVTYFTVPFNAEHLGGLQPGFDWHLGFAQLDTQVELTCGEQKVGAGRYKLNVRRGAEPSEWSVVLVPEAIARAQNAVRAARRRGDDTVQAAQAELDALLADLKAKGSATESVLPLAKFESGAEEHLTLTGIHHGYDTVARGSDEPAGGMHCSLRVSFGELHRQLELREAFTAPEKR